MVASVKLNYPIQNKIPSDNLFVPDQVIYENLAKWYDDFIAKNKFAKDRYDVVKRKRGRPEPSQLKFTLALATKLLKYGWPTFLFILAANLMASTLAILAAGIVLLFVQLILVLWAATSVFYYILLSYYFDSVDNYEKSNPNHNQGVGADKT